MSVASAIGEPPRYHWLPVDALDVNTSELPEQKLVAPAGVEIVGVAGVVQVPGFVVNDCIAV
jgi:hypothetical protein